MRSPYNTTSMSGFVLANSILTGRLRDATTPVVRFQLTSGDQAHPMFILKLKLAVEMYAWYATMRERRLEKVYVAATASLYSDGERSVMVANNIDFHVSNPQIRVEVERCMQDMLSGRWTQGWPETEVGIPLKGLGSDAARESA